MVLCFARQLALGDQTYFAESSLPVFQRDGDKMWAEKLCDQVDLHTMSTAASCSINVSPCLCVSSSQLSRSTCYGPNYYFFQKAGNSICIVSLDLVSWRKGQGKLFGVKTWESFESCPLDFKPEQLRKSPSYEPRAKDNSSFWRKSPGNFNWNFQYPNWKRSHLQFRKENTTETDKILQSGSKILL